MYVVYKLQFMNVMYVVYELQFLNVMYVVYELHSAFTFFYINRKMYWFRVNFRIPVFDGFTRFRKS